MDDLPEDLPFWPDIAATSENCIGADCPRFTDCFVTKMRQRAAESDVVIVNHHLLCADASVRQSAFGEVIPSCRYAIVDEAHQLEDVATQYFGTRGQQLPVRRLRARRRPRDRRRSRFPTATRADALRDDIDNVRDGARLFFGTLQMLRFERGAAGAESRVRVTAPLLERVAADAGGAGRARWRRSKRRSRSTKDVSEDVIALGRRAAELRDDVQFLTRADDPGHVYYLDIRGRGVFLRASPIDVSDIIREMLLDRMTATVLTSATLTVDGRFDYVRGRLGVRHAHEARLRLGVRLHAAGDPLPAEEDARPAVAAVRRRGRARGRRDPASARAAAPSSCSPATRTCAQVHQLAAAEIDVSDPRAGHARRGRRCCATSRPRRTPCCSPPPASGRASTSSASR